MDWQPIETAPKDGAKILVCSTDGRGLDARIVRWEEYAGPGQWYTVHGEAYWREDDFTHWMPLPPPPG
jgi:hypothetical protein